MHGHPEDIKRISEILEQQLGVVANKNPFGQSVSLPLGIEIEYG